MIASNVYVIVNFQKIGVPWKLMPIVLSCIVLENNIKSFKVQLGVTEK